MVHRMRRLALGGAVVNRAGDVVARYGGEEFVAVLSGTALEDARRIAGRMRQRVLDLAIPHERTQAGQVTISLGVATLVPARQREPMEAVLKADQALYMAKALGRNRVESVDA